MTDKMPAFSRFAINTVVFICGACVMILELVGSRLLAPYLGTSIYVWTSLIGIILGCLSLGYWWGGSLADRKPEVTVLSRIILLSGIFVTVIALAGDPVLILLQGLIPDVRINSAVSTLLLFGLPSILLGMVAPYAVRLKIRRLDQTGSTAGRLYALSTVGSIAGTFLAGFFLLSYFSHRSILFSLSIVLILLSLLLNKSTRFRISGVIAFLAVLGLSFTNSFVEVIMGDGFIEEHTAYNRVWIFDGYKGEQPLRAMQLNDSLDSVLLTDTDELFFDYAKYFSLTDHFQPDIKKALLIGGGAFIYPTHFLEKHPDASMDVVEIDPKLSVLAEKYFGLRDNPRMRIFPEDGRTFLNQTQEKYDVVFGDAYKSYSIPFQLATAEAMQLVSASMTDNGIFIVNVISGIEGKNGQFLRALLATMESVFAQVMLFAVDDIEDGTIVQNLIILGFNNTQTRRLTSADPELNYFLSHRLTNEIPRDKPVMTDALAPVERYTAPLIVQNSDLRNTLVQAKAKEYFNR